MALVSPWRWLAVVLLMAILAPDVVPYGGRPRCDCGMVVGCCCGFAVRAVG